MKSTLYILVEKRDSDNCHVSTCLTVLGKDFVNDIDMKLDGSDLKTIEKIASQFRASKFGKKVDVRLKIK